MLRSCQPGTANASYTKTNTKYPPSHHPHTPLSTSHQQQGPYEPGPTQGFLLLRGSSPPAVARVCNSCCANKVELKPMLSFSLDS